MTMLVVDASVAVKFVADEAGSDQAVALLRGSATLIAPDWLSAEVPNALWKKVARRQMTVPVARDAIVALPKFFARLYPTAELLPASYDLMFTLRHALYDCIYLALAQREGAAVVTADKEFFRAAAAAGMQADVSLLA